MATFVNFLASIPWLIVLGWLGSNIITYLLGRQKGIDAIKLKKKQELAEQMAVLLHDDYQARLTLRRFYENNFKHLTLHEAASAFDKHEVAMYMTQRQTMVDLLDGIGKLQQLNRQALIYV
jgi:hypothetical protein